MLMYIHLIALMIPELFFKIALWKKIIINNLFILSYLIWLD